MRGNTESLRIILSLNYSHHVSLKDPFISKEKRNKKTNEKNMHHSPLHFYSSFNNCNKPFRQ